MERGKINDAVKIFQMVIAAPSQCNYLRILCSLSFEWVIFVHASKNIGHSAQDQQCDYIAI